MTRTAAAPNLPLISGTFPATTALGRGAGVGSAGHASAGDPVDVATGVVHTRPLADLVLGGPLPLVIARSYCTATRDRDCGLGFGWSHSFDWEVTTDAQAVRVRAPHAVNFPRTPFTSGRAVIDELEVVRVDDELCVRDARDQRFYWFRCETENGANDSARQRWLLSRVSDEQGNEIVLVHERGRLSELRDATGRRLRVMRRSGRIRAFEVFDDQANEWVATRRYEHDEAGDLVAALDGYGRATRFRYVDHLLVEQRMPDGFAVHYRYDQTQRCTARWGAFDVGTDIALDPELPRLLADGKNPARGALHHTLEFFPRVVHVTTSLGLQRYFTNQTGKRTTSNLAPVNEAQLGDACRLLGYVLHAWGDPGPVVSYDYDTRGLLAQVVLPNGGSTMGHAAMGHRIGLRASNGGERCVSYTHDGRPRCVVDEHGDTTHFAYGRNRELLAIVDHSGAMLRKFSYDKNARLESITLRDGTYFELAYGGFDKIASLRRPDGSVLRFFYDREGNLVRVRRPDGTEHRISRDACGRIVAERTFDGRERT